MHVVPGPEFAALAARLTGPAQATLRKSMQKRIREATKPIERELQQAVRAVPVTSSRGGGRSARAAHRLAGRASVTESAARRARRGAGLRETVARAIQTKITMTGARTGIRLRVDGTKLPADQRGLPKKLDGQGTWRHPTFGHGPWVTQSGKPWWTATLDRMRPQLEQDMQAILADVKAELDRSL